MRTYIESQQTVKTVAIDVFGPAQPIVIVVPDPCDLQLGANCQPLISYMHYAGLCKIVAIM